MKINEKPQVFGYGLCQCGCGAKTAIATRNRTKGGHVKGEPFRFLPGHRESQFRSHQERFESHIYPDPNSGCFLFDGSESDGGYSQFEIDGKKFGAHRLAVFWSIGRLSADDVVIHKCDTPCCVNPDHLLVATDLANVADRARKRRSSRKGASLPLGVSYRDGRFQATVSLPGTGGRQKRLGRYDTIEEAASVVANAHEALYGPSLATEDVIARAAARAELYGAKP